MPSSDAIIAASTDIANRYVWVAVAWHAALAASIGAVVAGWRPGRRTAASFLGALSASVSAVAWLSGNPFNGLLFALFAIAQAALARTFSDEPVHVSSPGLLSVGLALLAFGWCYPHFLRTQTLVAYAYAAPVGLLPCPTLSVVIGVTLSLELLGSERWAITTAGAGVLYGIVGVVWLGVSIDVVLLAGALVLAWAAAARVVRTTTRRVP